MFVNPNDTSTAAKSAGASAGAAAVDDDDDETPADKAKAAAKAKKIKAVAKITATEKLERGCVWLARKCLTRTSGYLLHSRDVVSTPLSVSLSLNYPSYFLCFPLARSLPRSVPMATYWKYVRASGTWTMLLGVVGGQVFFNVVQGVSNWWLGYWWG